MFLTKPDATSRDTQHPGKYEQGTTATPVARFSFPLSIYHGTLIERLPRHCSSSPPLEPTTLTSFLGEFTTVVAAERSDASPFLCDTDVLDFQRLTYLEGVLKLKPPSEQGDQNVPPVAVANTTPVDGQTTNPSTAPTTLQPAATIRSGPVRERGRGLSVAGRTVNSSAHAPPNPDQDVAMADLSSSVDPNATPTTPANPPGTKSQKERSRSKKSEKRVIVDENTPATALTATIVQEVSAQAQAIAKTVPRKHTISVDADSSAAKVARLEDSLKHKSLEELTSMATNVMTLDRESLWALFTLGDHYRDNHMRSNTVESLLNLRNVQDSAFLLVDLLREHQDRLQDFSDKGGQTLSEIAKAKDEVLAPADPYPTPMEEDKVLDEAEPLSDAVTVVAHVSAPPSLAPSEQSYPDSETSYQTV
ncbi:hypothetical protein K435DRAFT_877007 [Dendrothele bispora CBS 962.96]|uniref:Uncharacterized protein n=1 Tax=Dendrothele bispora (strain CBS 962.96) TaxID=1314807 RepID=A0A4S8KQT9_DENBC|nr:hypothetical protein K435DRAFT_877007 [Dendrothele bispora CBS 962.96]